MTDTYVRCEEIINGIRALPPGAPRVNPEIARAIVNLFLPGESGVFIELDERPGVFGGPDDWHWRLRQVRNMGEGLFDRLAGRDSDRTPAKRYDPDTGKHIGPGPWLDLIHKCNELVPGFFGAPTHPDDDYSVEVYPDAKVIHLPNEEVAIVPTTPFGEKVLRRALNPQERWTA